MHPGNSVKIQHIRSGMNIEGKDNTDTLPLSIL